MFDQESFTQNMIEAERRAIEPLLGESIEALSLSEQQALDMDGFLTQAWVSGALAAHANMTSKILDNPLDLDEFETRVKPLVLESADTLNLTVTQTLHMWDFLSQAMVCGVKSTETELTAMLIEDKHDISAEALDWIQKRGES